MTKKEMTELFSLMMLAWPSAEMFKGGTEKLGPTISLWTTCTKEIDFPLGKQVTYRLCRQNKYPPTIAEFRQSAADIDAELRRQFESAFMSIRESQNLSGGLEEYFDMLTPDDPIAAAVRCLGGLDKLTVVGDDAIECWNIEAMRKAFFAVVKERLSGNEQNRRLLT